MKRLLLILACVVVTSVTGAAHFVFVVPQPGSTTARVLLSETLQPDAQVDVELIAGAQLSLRDPRGHDTPLTFTKTEHAFTVTLPAASRGVVHGVADLGVITRGNASHLLVYYPKTILGDPFDASSQLGSMVPVELVPSGRPGAVMLQLRARQKPLANAEVTVLTPDGSQRVVKTDSEGRTEAFSQTGRYGAWARYWEPTQGERQGQRFVEIRHYATLVFDVPSGQAVSPTPQATRVATLPEPTSSFGAVAVDGWLYVYGGHVSPTHLYSTTAVSGRFSRLRLPDGQVWESLPAGPAMQGMNLAAYNGRVYRVGGMQPQNRSDDPEDIRSLADVARFNPSTRQWEPLPPLPAPRSSHDVVVSGSQLFVIGGWNLKGKSSTADWPTTVEVLNVASASPTWTSLPQPFKRRAFIAVAHDKRIYVLGGFDERNRVVRGMDIYDIARGSWSTGPALPGDAMNGFGPAAAVVNDRLIVSINDGSLHRLSTDRTAWELVGQASPRIVHRLVADGDRVLILGGAKSGANLDLIEALSLRP